jgi:hypothetical protein
MTRSTCYTQFKHMRIDKHHLKFELFKLSAPSRPAFPRQRGQAGQGPVDDSANPSQGTHDYSLKSMQTAIHRDSSMISIFWPRAIGLAVFLRRGICPRVVCDLETEIRRSSRAQELRCNASIEISKIILYAAHTSRTDPDKSTRRRVFVSICCLYLGVWEQLNTSNKMTSRS